MFRSRLFRSRLFRSRRSRRRPRRPRAGRIALAGLLTTPLVAGCFAEPSPQPAVTAFLLAWQSGDYRGAARLTTGDAKTVETALRQVREQIDSAALSLRLDEVRKSGDQGYATFTVHVDLGENGSPWDYQSRLAVRRVDRTWKVVWAPSVIHPGLGPGQRLAVVTESSEREPINDSSGRSLLRNTKVEIVGVHPGALKNPAHTIGELARVTGLDGDRLLGRIRAARPRAFFPLLTLQLPEQAGEARRLRGIPGLSFRTSEMPVAPAMAPELIGTLGAATAQRLQEVGAPYQPGDTIGVSGMQLLFQRRLAGTPGVKVVAQDIAGDRSTVLKEWRGLPSAAVTTTIDRRVQLAAQRALSGRRGPAALIAVHTATGRILAVANHRTNGQNLAMTGRFRPGMTFTIVSSEALLRAGQQLSGSTPCPKTQRVGGRMFRNPGPAVGTGGGEASFRAGFAASCATAFAGLASRLGPGELTASAGRFGIGADWGLPVPAFSGSVPSTTELAENAAMMVGEGDVEMSPLGMALVAAAVESGTWRPPRLILDPPIPPKAAALPLDADRLEDLRRLMRSAVSTGTARAANLRGTPVFGVVANVQQVVNGQSKPYSWFVGFRGDTAFAVVAEGKEPVSKDAARFLRTL